MNSNLVIRILLLCTPFVLPWWLVIIFAIAALFWFETYWEIFLIGVFLDILYVTTYTAFGPYICTISAFILFLLSVHIKKRLIVY